MDQETLEQAFMSAFGEYSDAIFRFCVVKVSDHDRASDMTQEVFMRFWQSLRSGKEMTNTRSYLYTIANNLAKDWYKKKKADSLDEQMEAGFEPGLPATQESDAQYQELLAVIADMEENDRAVLLMRHVEGLEPREIAEIMNETPNVISVRLNRASKRLRERLDQ